MDPQFNNLCCVKKFKCENLTMFRRLYENSDLVELTNTPFKSLDRDTFGVILGYLSKWEIKSLFFVSKILSSKFYGVFMSHMTVDPLLPLTEENYPGVQRVEHYFHTLEAMTHLPKTLKFLSSRPGSKVPLINLPKSLETLRFKENYYELDYIPESIKTLKIGKHAFGSGLLSNNTLKSLQFSGYMDFPSKGTSLENLKILFISKKTLDTKDKKSICIPNNVEILIIENRFSSSTLVDIYSLPDTLVYLDLDELNLVGHEKNEFKFPPALRTFICLTLRLHKKKISFNDNLKKLEIRHCSKFDINYLPKSLEELIIHTKKIRLDPHILPNTLKILKYKGNPIDFVHFGLWPETLTHITLGGQFNCPLLGLPEGLIYLKLGDEFNDLIDNIPESLKFLYVGYGFDQEVKTLPKNLQVFTMKGGGRGAMKLPESLKHLMIENRSGYDSIYFPPNMKSIDINILYCSEPNIKTVDYMNVTTLQFNIPPHINIKALNLQWIPNDLRLEIKNQGLKYLRIFGHLSENQLPISLPDTLEYLCYDPPRLHSNMPHCLKTLILNGDFNESIDNLPLGLENLSLGCKFNQPIKCLPKSLLRLEFGFGFNQPLKNIPKGLRYLKLSDLFNHPLKNLPKTLRILHIGTSFKQPIDNLPNGLKYLYLHCEDTLPSIIKIPEGTIEVTFSSITPERLAGIQFPSSVRLLRIPRISKLKHKAVYKGTIKLTSKVKLNKWSFDDEFESMIPSCLKPKKKIKSSVEKLNLQ